MKTCSTHSMPHREAGILLVECVVYIAVFAILLSVATVAFYQCWDYSKALRYSTDDIESALRAGEYWRADIRAADGRIILHRNAGGETVQMPQKGQTVVYRFANGQLCREIPAQNISRVLLTKIKNSDMQPDPRGNVSAWCWELELIQRRPQMHLPLAFTFEAVGLSL